MLVVSMSLLSCKTYYIPLESFKEQMAGHDQLSMQEIDIQGPLNGTSRTLVNTIDYIECVDKNNNVVLLKNSPSIEMRITDINKKRTVFYFDSVYLLDSLIIGQKSRFIGIQKEIPLNHVKLIEVQDGKKKFKYINKK